MAWQRTGVVPQHPVLLQLVRCQLSVATALVSTAPTISCPVCHRHTLSTPTMPCPCSVSIATTFKEDLFKAGVIFCSISEAVKEYPDLVKKHMGSVVSANCMGGGSDTRRGKVVSSVGPAWVYLERSPCRPTVMPHRDAFWEGSRETRVVCPVIIIHVTNKLGGLGRASKRCQDWGHSRARGPLSAPQQGLVALWPHA